MAYVVIHTSEPIHWNIDPNDLLRWQFLPDIGVKMVNPFLSDVIYRYKKNPSISIVDERPSIFSSKVFYFTIEQETISNLIVDKIVERLHDFINSVYYHKKQFHLNNMEIRYIETHNDENLEVLKLLPENNKLITKDYIFDTAINYRTYNSLISNTATNYVYVNIMLNSINSFTRKDYLNSLLYCGIACEIALMTCCDDLYDQILENSENHSFRIINEKVKGGSNIKDPVYLALRDRCNFEQKLHLLLLYIRGKSLKVDNEVLFSSIKKIYSTRNKIAHLGDTMDNQAVYSINLQNSAEALRSAVSFFKWLNLDYGFPVPGLEGWERKYIGFEQNEIDEMQGVMYKSDN